MEPFIGEIRMFGGNFAPRSWAYCNGQLLAISQNQALFSILGTTYGGDGRTTFALPDLRGRVPIQHGSGPGLSSHSLGQRGGTVTNNLTINNLPSHSHTASLTGKRELPVNSTGVDSDSPSGAFPGSTGSDFYAASASAGAFMGAVDTAGLVPHVENTGGGQSINNLQPYTAVNYIIAIEGTFPSRN
jgi:microcystin-dependent protein